ncbi:hypothetical protein GO684_00105 [Wolbachia endosymbiont of Litomosoides brasiliensis]|nr:hypothetical protein [Wolbachia endosymbiont of Litomosoides brasiliensis]NUY39162.1 hypothetical protein [Wolbachia endosymbiont of Litomosoides brasiliensis]
MLHFKNSTNYMNKAPEIWKRRKIVCSLQRHKKTRLNQSQFEQVEVWMQRNPNIIIENKNLRKI